ncbi:MAG: DUF6465 family protein [Oscillospiraceae bacterium]|nr:DUF6465 family protein [Ruminococcus sp.]MDD6098202.1 DUF6465 family protein [Oscillospiraceae bacterium]
MARTKKASASTTAEKTVKAVAETVKNETVTAEPVKEEAPKAKTAKAEITKKPAAKKTAAKPAKKAVNSNVYVQFNNSEAHTCELVAKAISDSGVEAPDNVDVYVRPEINKVYYVIDGNKFGDFELF